MSHTIKNKLVLEEFMNLKNNNSEYRFKVAAYRDQLKEWGYELMNALGMFQISDEQHIIAIYNADKIEAAGLIDIAACEPKLTTIVRAMNETVQSDDKLMKVFLQALPNTLTPHEHLTT